MHGAGRGLYNPQPEYLSSLVGTALEECHSSGISSFVVFWFFLQGGEPWTKVLLHASSCFGKCICVPPNLTQYSVIAATRVMSDRSYEGGCGNGCCLCSIMSS